jgi:hypothetical protein
MHTVDSWSQRSSALSTMMMSSLVPRLVGIDEKTRVRARAEAACPGRVPGVSA